RELHNHSNVGVLWVPVKKEEDLVLGLWLERWHQDAAGIPPQETVKLITQTLAPAFAASCKHLHRGRQWLSALREKKTALIATSIILVLALFAIRVPLRVVAPCEVVAREPIYITAPIEGIIDQLVVTPGALVKEGDLLYRYNADEALSNLSVATKQVELMQRSVQRAIALGSTDEKALRELSLLRIKLEQEQARLKLAQTVADKSEGRAPVAGIAVIDDPERWRGRPVQIGEKILTVSDPSKTKVRIWLPESDNIALNKDEPLKVYLNVDPSTSYEAQMTYIANGSSLNEHKLPSFISDAEWLSDSPPDRIGLKGTAIAYGDKVSLFYYLLRRPWTSFRNYVGI
ncbi:MAG: HlyD family efflux transporter periplasmic adaptor subunit, partial [Chlamydiia bacterium]|nr:HlyD family efflux transporter periplasmic adaptor subunit [Chlamydiia bacterium]